MEKFALAHHTNKASHLCVYLHSYDTVYKNVILRFTIARNFQNLFEYVFYILVKIHFHFLSEIKGFQELKLIEKSFQ